jgi:general secretion pathway protein J
MKHSPLPRAHQADAGFTLIEALVAVALMGLIVGALATVTAQWLPNWNRGLLRIQRNEQVAIALDRLVADLSAAEYVSGNRDKNAPLFQGNELGVAFVRSAIGPNSRPGLEIVQIAGTADSNGPILVRTRAPFVPLPTGDLALDPVPFADPVVLLRAPFRVAFAYAGPEGVWRTTWQGSSGILPSAVRFTVRDVSAERTLPVSSATMVHVGMGAPQPEQENEPDGGAPLPTDARGRN